MPSKEQVAKLTDTISRAELTLSGIQDAYEEFDWEAVQRRSDQAIEELVRLGTLARTVSQK
jgi:hypothetical protein